MITVLRVIHHYGVRPVLNDVSLHVRRGELLALMGPNGMGKSTLMGVMAGLLSPISGTVEVDGMQRRRTTEEELAIRRKIVYLPATPYIPTLLTGREWLLAVGRLYEVPELRLFEHVDRLLDLFDLTDKGDSLPGSYSTGQRKKLSLAGALVAQTPIMLLDEPFSGGLDPSGILALKRVLQWRVKHAGATVVLATPVPELVSEMADRVAVVRDGRIVACDTIDMLRIQAGVSGGLDEAYERLANPKAVGNVDSYLEAMGR